MCGICGIISNDSNKLSRIQPMVDSMHHRGPDANGKAIFNKTALGHTRLSIVDLKDGAQPMYNKNKNVAITFNGEIYGYKKIKKNIRYNYKTSSDTEVIIALYETYGLKMLDYLPGMFAFAIWDEKRQRLFCARDRFGEKPFYYQQTKTGDFLFCSEIKAIIASEIEKPKVSSQSLTQYLQRGYTGPDFTIFKNIQSLPPAHYLIYENNKITINRYWNFPKVNRNISYYEAKEFFKEKLEQAVDKQLVADVDVGSFLSGGIDSSSIVTVASKFKPCISTYSFGFNKEFNELPIAAKTAKKNNTKHKEMMVEDVDLIDIIWKLPDIYDEPFADSSTIPTYIICEKASKYNKVVLGGEGGDELTGGYTWWFFDLMLMNRLKGISSYQESIITFMAALEKLGSMASITNSTEWRTKRYLNNCNKIYPTLLHKYLQTGLRYTNEEFNKLGLPNYEIDLPNQFDTNEQVNDVFNHIIQTYMAGDILVKTDRAGMAHSLELRSPLLDVDFASFCLSLPPEYKINNNRSKRIFKGAMQSELVDDVLNKPKQGFGAPQNWEDNPLVNDFKEKILKDPQSKIYQWLPFEETAAMMDRTGNFWEWLVLAVWFEKFYSKIE